MTIDAVTFEVLRHRLSTIVEEGAAILRSISGSPSVAQSNDCNVALLTAGGEGVVIGRYIASHAISCIRTTRHVLGEYGENPGIREGDMFFTNHPYIGTPHQTCGAMVAPIFAEGQIVAWSGVGIHFGDVGGSTPGQVSIGAQSIWAEAIPMPPIKMVEGGVLRKDIEEDFLIRSRTRVQNAVDLKAMVGAHTAIKRRVLTLVRRYGVETFQAAMQQTIAVAEAKLRSILREIPDGSWSAENYLDYYDREQLEVYACRLTLTKSGDELTFDFRRSSKQAPAVINATFGTTEGYLLRAILGIFGFAVAHCPAAIQRILHIEATPGTIMHCTWPAGVCKGTTSVTQSIWHTAVSALSQMLAGSEPYGNRSAAVSRGHLALLDLQGSDQYGAPFAAVINDAGNAAGSGANPKKDGIDTGGATEPEVSIPNVESIEFRYPILYLYRRQRADSGGEGEARGGVGISLAFIPHAVDAIPNVMIHSHGVTMPSAPGLGGGYPGAMNTLAIRRGTNIAEFFRRGIMPVDLARLNARLEEKPAPFAYTNLAAGDVFECTGGGGGGFGDPLERAPGDVQHDVAYGLVTRERARDGYGVMLDGGISLDAAGTAHQRARLRAGRRLEAQRSKDRLSEGEPPCRCGARIGEDIPVRETILRADVFGKRSATPVPSYAIRELFCPNCWALLDVKVFVAQTMPAVVGG